MLVSVIVAVYNVDPLIDRCVESIRRQTHHDLEIILVDDGSTDGSGQRCDEHARADSRVVVVHQANSGLAAARNAGLEHATGTHILFVDGDDWIHDELVGRLLALLDGSDNDIAAATFQRVNSPAVQPIPAHPEVRHFGRDKALLEWAGARHTALTISCGKLTPRRFFDHVAFPPGRLHEDEFTTYLLLAQAQTVHLTMAPLYYYWHRPDSIMGSEPTVDRSLDAIAAYRQQLTFLTAHEHHKAAVLVRGQLIRKLADLLSVADPREDREVFQDTRAELRDEARRGPAPLRAFALLHGAAPGPARLIRQSYLRLATARRSRLR